MRHGSDFRPQRIRERSIEHDAGRGGARTPHAATRRGGGPRNANWKHGCSVPGHSNARHGRVRTSLAAAASAHGVFTTAYDQYALKAFEVNSIDYLLKPVEPGQLERALAKQDGLYSG